MADYWLKLYMEILDDPKMATLPDRLWRRVIELFMVAKLENKDGLLPEVQHIAWRLRISTDDLLLDLRQIATTGIITAAPEGWKVTNFAKRQAAVPGAERIRQYRGKEHKQEYYEGVTNAKRNVTQIKINRLTDIDTEEDTESEPPPQPNIFKLYEQNIGAITPKLADLLKDAEKEYPADWIPEAFEEAVKNNVRKWSYIAAILENWKKDGRGKKNGKNKTQPDKTNPDYYKKSEYAEYYNN